jgi:hypothetical protein
MRNKQLRPQNILNSICHRHHFSNPNTTEIIFSLLFVGVVYKAVDLLSRTTKY